MELPFESALFVIAEASIPSLKFAKATLEVGPKILFSKAFYFSAHASILAAMSVTSGT